MSISMDLSQISDIHNISPISDSHGSRIIGRTASLQSLYEPHSTLSHISRSATKTNQGLKQVDKTLKNFVSCEESLALLVKNRIVIESLIEVSANPDARLPAEVSKKLERILLNDDLNKYIHLPLRSSNIQEELTVLGITDLLGHELSFAEKLDIKCQVETVLREKIKNFMQRYENLGGNVKEVLKQSDCNARKKLFEPFDTQKQQLLNKIDDLCAMHESNIKRYKDSLNEWYKLKYKDMQGINLEKAEHLLAQAKVQLQQAKITSLSSTIRMFKETSVTHTAFTMLNSSLENKLQEVVNEIAAKKSLKAQYDSLHNSEYDKVLKTYLDVCKAIQKKKHILQSL